MKLEIRSADGGYIVVAQYAKITTEHVVTEFRDLLHLIQDLMGECGGRHDEKRIYIIEAPGDKHEKFTEAHAEVIYGSDDTD
jgi:hypothetical protein